MMTEKAGALIKLLGDILAFKQNIDFPSPPFDMQRVSDDTHQLNLLRLGILTDISIPKLYLILPIPSRATRKGNDLHLGNTDNNASNHKTTAERLSSRSTQDSSLHRPLRNVPDPETILQHNIMASQGPRYVIIDTARPLDTTSTLRRQEQARC